MGDETAEILSSRSAAGASASPFSAIWYLNVCPSCISGCSGKEPVYNAVPLEVQSGNPG